MHIAWLVTGLVALAGCATQAPVPEKAGEVLPHDALEEAAAPKDAAYQGAGGVYSFRFQGDRHVVLARPLVAGEANPSLGGNALARVSSDLREFVFLSGIDAGQDWVAPDEPGQWYRPGVPWAAGNENKVHLFAYRMEHASKADPDASRIVGCDVLTFENSLETPIETRPIPQCASQERPDLYWGAAALTHESHVYIFGVRDAQPRELFVARSTIATFDKDPTQGWQYWSETRWVESLDKAQPILTRVSSELGVMRINDERFAIVYQLDDRSNEIAASYSLDLQGPWSGPRTIATLPEQSGRTFTNAKLHATLGDRRSVVISYDVLPTSQPGNRSEMPSYYYPRFLIWKPRLGK